MVVVVVVVVVEVVDVVAEGSAAGIVMVLVTEPMRPALSVTVRVTSMVDVDPRTAGTMRTISSSSGPPLTIGGVGKVHS